MSTVRTHGPCRHRFGAESRDTGSSTCRPCARCAKKEIQPALRNCLAVAPYSWSRYWIVRTLMSRSSAARDLGHRGAGDADGAEGGLRAADREVVGLDLVALREDDRALDRVLELTH